MPKRRKYSAEFKREAIALTRQPGVSCRQVALEIGITPNLLTRWLAARSRGGIRQGVRRFRHAPR